MPETPSSPALQEALVWPAAVLACVGPVVMAYSVPPSSTMLNQLLACGGWGLFTWALALKGKWMVLPGPLRSAIAPSCASLGLIAASMLVAMVWRGLPTSLGLSGLAVLACAAACLLAGAVAAAQGDVERAMAPFALGLLLAGLVSVPLAAIQVLVPDWADGTWVAAAALPGRAAGNLRQPNHLSTLMLWSLVALVWLGAARGWRLAALLPIAALLVLAVVLSGSRTGALGVLVLAGWGLLDRTRLPGRLRLLLVALPLIYAVQWLAVAHWGSEGSHVFGGAGRFSASGDVSSSRFAIWSDTLTLIARFPWEGVGYGNFNRAWSLSVMPHRPLAFFDHTHNLPLQLAVELGLPIALLTLALLGVVLWRAWNSGRHGSPSHHSLACRAAFMMVLLVALHSLLEYPLWYTYFLLPAAYALGLCIGSDAHRAFGARVMPEPAASPKPQRSMSLGLQVCGALMVLGSTHAVADYWKVAIIFQPGNSTQTLAERIEAGKKSVYFAHHAHYADATTAARPSEAIPAFQVASHFLLDTRLMMAWARAYAESGDLPRARHLADRLREFHNAASKSFFDECDKVPSDGESLPFQCKAGSGAFDHRDFH